MKNMAEDTLLGKHCEGTRDIMECTKKSIRKKASARIIWRRHQSEGIMNEAHY